MRRLTLQITDRQLILRRDRRKDFLCVFGVFGATFLFALWVLGPPSRWSVLTGDRLPRLALGLTLCVGYVWRLSRNLRRQDWVLDRTSGQVTLNGRLVEALREMESVCLDRGYYDHTKSFVLYLRTKSRVLLEIARDGAFGVGTLEMWEVADALAYYAGLNLVTPDGFRPGHVGKRRRRLRKTTLPRKRRSGRIRASSGAEDGPAMTFPAAQEKHS